MLDDSCGVTLDSCLYCGLTSPMPCWLTMLRWLQEPVSACVARWARHPADLLTRANCPIWTSAADERFGLGPYIVLGDRLIAFKEDGELYVYQLKTNSMTLLHKQRVMEEGVDAWGPMAYADGMLIVRDSKTIKCLKIEDNG